MPPKITTWNTIKLNHVLLRMGDDQKVAVIEAGYSAGDATDPVAKRNEFLIMDRTHPLLAKTIAQAIASTSPRLSVVDALVVLLIADIKEQEGL